MGNFDLVDLDNDYFLVKLDKEEDYTRVLTELTVHSWSREFSTVERYSSKVIVWVRLSRLPYRYYTKMLLRSIASLIERVIRVDYNTNAGEKGRFARIAVVVNLNKPLIPCISVDNFNQKTGYEGLQQICFNCGIYGHAKENCNLRKEGMQTNDKVNPPPQIEENQMERIENPSTQRENQTSTKNEIIFGLWMVVTNEPRRPRRKNTQENKEEENGNQKSKFAPLEDSNYLTEKSKKRRKSYKPIKYPMK
ncbi:uncharacterized protein LOC120208632 [Hibiscus syriacus]|uniref:uncharacterized protein LOC120208632 n=1 Tax=Hibiscus syriacus TaxID=106335 RepID=UPI001922F6EC|nr:uncharacterized protein LOC120208632 [Hibiscus syriacus]